MVRRVRLFAAALVAILGVASAPGARAQGGAFEIDVIAALTGPGAFIGKQDVDTLGAVERIANKAGGVRATPIHFLFHDDQTNPQVSVQIADQLIAKKVAVIMGPSITATCRAVTPRVVQNGPVLYCLTPGVVPARGGFQFSSGVPTTASLVAVFDELRKKKWNRLAVLTTIDATGQDAEAGVDLVASRPEYKAIQIVAREHFNNTDVSIAAQMARIKAANPDLLLAWTTGPPVGTVFAGVQQAGLDVPVVTSASNQTYQQMKQYAAMLPRHLQFSSYLYTTGDTQRANRAALLAFYQACAELGAKPDLQVGFAWDPALIVIDAFRHVGSNASAAQLHDYIEQLHGFAGIDGIYDFRDGNNRGIGAAVAFMLEWDPANQRFAVVR